ncbi:unnamed protein product [Pleuronectes platessa]|uniref:Uncharacterized protein n=1 Tax=Pleuronectes platessa TaxID=8262 RepID=A0A9N7UPE8_PLEPL|nr:unnamed protein product [Pleuronectes platessa]
MPGYHVGAFARLKQLFSEDPSSEPREDPKEPDLEADGQPDGVADREEDRDDFEDDVEDNMDDEVEDNGDDKDYDPMEEGQDHGCTTTPTGLVERETFKSRNGEIIWFSRAYSREGSRCSSSAVYAALSGASTFCLLITPTAENIILEMTNQ